MQVSEALKQRHSTRAFLDKPVSGAVIRRILEAAGHAPSGTNTQPWQVAVVSGRAKRGLSQKLERAFREGRPRNPDYQYYPLEWTEPYKSRRKACGLQLYSSLNIGREDKDKQRDQWAANYRAFDAPAALFFFMDRIMEKGSYIDYGMFLQSIMLAAVEEGLATCPQASLAEYPGIVKKELDYPEDCVLLCGMAIGYEDAAAPINGYRTPRLRVEEYARFYDGSDGD
ncbi:MAG: nitroreductase [Gammaproteobacteria bacterium]